MNPKQFLLFLALVASIRIGAAQATSFNFDTDAAEKPPSGFTSYATGGGPAGKWLVKQMADAQSGKHVVVQTDADRTDYRFPVLIANEGGIHRSRPERESQVDFRSDRSGDGIGVPIPRSEELLHCESKRSREQLSSLSHGEWPPFAVRRSECQGCVGGLAYATRGG
jgi:hypothetical protein